MLSTLMARLIWRRFVEVITILAIVAVADWILSNAIGYLLGWRTGQDDLWGIPPQFPEAILSMVIIIPLLFRYGLLLTWRSCEVVRPFLFAQKRVSHLLYLLPTAEGVEGHVAWRAMREGEKSPTAVSRSVWEGLLALGDGKVLAHLPMNAEVKMQSHLCSARLKPLGFQPRAPQTTVEKQTAQTALEKLTKLARMIGRDIQFTSKERSQIGVVWTATRADLEKAWLSRQATRPPPLSPKNPV